MLQLVQFLSDDIWVIWWEPLLGVQHPWHRHKHWGHHFIEQRLTRHIFTKRVWNPIVRWLRRNWSS